MLFDEIVQAVLDDHVGWEFNAVINNRERRGVKAIGYLIRQRCDPPIPFPVMISDRNSRE
jgi:hypothetical protein